MAPSLDELIDSASKAKSIVDLKLIITGLIHSLKENNANCKRNNKTLQDKITDLREEKTQLERTIANHEATIESLEEKVIAAQSERQELGAKIVSSANEATIGPNQPQPTKIQEVQDALDSTNQYARRGALTLSGKGDTMPVFANTEDSKQIVINLIQTHTGITLAPNEISIAHRLGRKKDDTTNDRRSIRFRLVRRDLVPGILAACKDRRPPIFVNPSLTPIRANILHEIRKLKVTNGQILKSYRVTLNGDIEVFTSTTAEGHPNNLKKHIIVTKKQLEDFATKVLNIPAPVS